MGGGVLTDHVANVTEYVGAGDRAKVTDKEPKRQSDKVVLSRHVRVHMSSRGGINTTVTEHNKEDSNRGQEADLDQT
jgi:hypothetical protein